MPLDTPSHPMGNILTLVFNSKVFQEFAGPNGQSDKALIGGALKL